MLVTLRARLLLFALPHIAQWTADRLEWLSSALLPLPVFDRGAGTWSIRPPLIALPLDPAQLAHVSEAASRAAGVDDCFRAIAGRGPSCLDDCA